MPAPSDAGAGPDPANGPGEASSANEASEGAQVRADLSLSEALLLLALGDDDGRVHHSAHKTLPFGLAGAVLLVLASRGRLRHAEGVWTVTDETPTGDAALDAALETLAAEQQPRGSLHWLRVLPDAGETRLQQRLLQGLVARGVLEERTHRFLGLVPYRRYPTENPGPERRMREHVRHVVLEEETADDRTRVLLALLKACALTDEVFTKREQRAAADRLNALAEEHHAARGVSEVSAEAVAAVLRAAGSATMAATRSI